MRLAELRPRPRRAQVAHRRYSSQSRSRSSAARGAEKPTRSCRSRPRRALRGLRVATAEVAWVIPRNRVPMLAFRPARATSADRCPGPVRGLPPRCQRGRLRCSRKMTVLTMRLRLRWVANGRPGASRKDRRTDRRTVTNRRACQAGSSAGGSSAPGGRPVLFSMSNACCKSTTAAT